MSIITNDRLRNILSYNPDTGDFVWISPPKNHTRMFGCVAGCGSTGYILIRIDGQKYKAHRLAWLYVRGELPRLRIDHKDGDPFNNKWTNLRLASQAENIANARRRAGKILPKGVRRAGRKYVARISFEKILRVIGTFDTPEMAADAYFQEAKRLYGQFARAS